MIKLSDFTISKFSKTLCYDILKKYGVVIIDKWLDSGELKLLESDWKKIRELKKNSEINYISEVGGKNFDYASYLVSSKNLKRFDTIEAIFKKSEPAKFLNLIIKKPVNLNAEIYATYDVGSSTNIADSHFDKTWTLKMMIYLNDINEYGDGAFGVHPCTTDIARDKFRNWFKNNSIDNEMTIGSDNYYKMLNTDEDGIPPAVDIYGKAGTLIIFSTDCYHRGGFLKKNNIRKIIRGHTYPGKMLSIGDSIKKGSNHWLRDENWNFHKSVPKQSFFSRILGYK